LTRAVLLPALGKATFRFGAKGDASNYECRLTRSAKRTAGAAKARRFRRCSSPKTYRHLGAGSYRFEVRASGPGGTDKTPVKRRFTL
jgi:hypothetical protein